MNLGEFQDDVRRHGLARAVLRAAYYRAHASMGVRAYRFLVLEPGHVNADLLERATPYEGRFLEPDQLAALPLDAAAGVTASAIAAAAGKRQWCFALFDGAELASWGWYSPVPAPVDGGAFTVRFDPRYVYMFNGYTKPAHRGRNLHGIGLARATAALCARGYAGVVTIAERVNFASLRSAHRVGYRDCGLALCIRIGGVTRVWQSRGPERYGLGLEPISPAQRVTVQSAGSRARARDEAIP